MIRQIVVAIDGSDVAHLSEVPDGASCPGAGSDPTARLMAELCHMAGLESVRVESHPLASDPAEAGTRVVVEERAVCAVLVV